MTKITVLDFFAKEWKETEGIIADFVARKMDISKKEKTISARLYKDYIDPICDLAKNESLRGVIGMLDIDVARKFLENSDNKEARDALSEQIILIGLALGQNPLNISPYSKEELEGISMNAVDFYDDFTFAFTLGCLAEKKGEAGSADMLLRILGIENGKLLDLEREYGWNEIFLMALMLRAIWANFLDLKDENRKIILQNCFYLSAIFGIKFRGILVDYIEMDPGKKGEKLVVIGNCLSESREQVPLTNNLDRWKNFSELIKQYGIKLGGSGQSGFILEEFVDGFYKNEPQREVYKRWIREALATVSVVSNQISTVNI